jgi:hypothetical protein
MKSIFNIMIVLMTFQWGTISYGQTKKNSRNYEAPEANTKICKGFYKLVSDECARSICLLMTDEETDDCAQDGTFWEAHNMCVYDELLPNLIENYNANHPTKKIKCDTVEIEAQTILRSE